MWHSAVIDFGCVTSRTPWVKFSRVKVFGVVVVVYAPTEGDFEDRVRFWNELDKVVNRKRESRKLKERMRRR